MKVNIKVFGEGDVRNLNNILLPNLTELFTEGVSDIFNNKRASSLPFFGHCFFCQKLSRGIMEKGKRETGRVGPWHS